MYLNPKGSILFNEETMEVFPLKLGTRQECPLFLLLFNKGLMNSIQNGGYFLGDERTVISSRKKEHTGKGHTGGL